MKESLHVTLSRGMDVYHVTLRDIILEWFWIKSKKINNMCNRRKDKKVDRTS